MTSLKAKLDALLAAERKAAAEVAKSASQGVGVITNYLDGQANDGGNTIAQRVRTAPTDPEVERLRDEIVAEWEANALDAAAWRMKLHEKPAPGS